MTIARVSCDAVTVHCCLGMAEFDSGLLLSSLREFHTGPPCYCSQVECFAWLQTEWQYLFRPFVPTTLYLASCAGGLSRLVLDTGGF